MAISLNRVVNANVYLGGTSFLGRAAEIDLPELKAKMDEHKTLGMAGTAELPSGLDKLEAKIKWNSFYPDALVAAANPFRFVLLQARASVESYAGPGRIAEAPLVCTLNASFKKLPLGQFKQHENVDLETELAVYYVKLSIDGADIVEVDVLANLWRVAGSDLLAKYRLNIGG